MSKTIRITKGRMAVCDPCYTGELDVASLDVRHPDHAVAVQSGIGDGFYPLYLRFDEAGDNVTEVIAVFLPEGAAAVDPGGDCQVADLCVDGGMMMVADADATDAELSIPADTEDTAPGLTIRYTKYADVQAEVEVPAGEWEAEELEVDLGGYVGRRTAALILRHKG